MKRSELVEIRENKTGTGLLIEHDGHIAITDGNNKQLVESFRENDEWRVPYPFIVDAVFQKSDIKNANGRIYPARVLRKQIEIYQQKINEKRAYGECYTPDVLILTENGWKTLESVKEGENIITLNTTSNQIEVQPIQRKIEKDYDGDMIRIEGRNINDLVTPNHGYPVYNNGEFKNFYTATEILNDETKQNEQTYIPTKEDDTKIFLNSIKTSKEYYKGKVMCVEVENHTWYVMSNDKCHWTKNCNHPSDSTIDLGRIAMNIVELHWENKTVVGKLELITSEGFRKSGIISCLGDTCANLILNGLKIGVSSRGIGSVEQKMGQYLVGDDFELICWDIVSDPSTPQAWISTSQEEIQTYVENKDSDKSKIMIEKIEKVKNLLK